MIEVEKHFSGYKVRLGSTETNKLTIIAKDNNTNVESLLQLILRVEANNNFEGVMRYYNP